MPDINIIRDGNEEIPLESVKAVLPLNPVVMAGPVQLEEIKKFKVIINEELGFPLLSPKTREYGFAKSSPACKIWLAVIDAQVNKAGEADTIVTALVEQDELMPTMLISQTKYTIRNSLNEYCLRFGVRECRKYRVA